MYSLLDQIVSNHSDGCKIVSQQHDASKIALEQSAIDAALRGNAGVWDASEYGLTAEQVQARIDAASTPEAKEKVMADLRARALQRASLDTSNGRVNMFAAGELPWHSLGVLVDRAASSAEAIRLAGLDWQVAKKSLHYSVNGNSVTVPDAFAIARSDTWAPLGTVGKRYQVIQNAEAFDFLDGVLGEFGAKYESAGSLYGGKKVWMLAKMPSHAFRINGGDDVEPYVIFANCHDGTGSAFCYPTTVRVVCANTFRISHKERSKGLSIRHTGNVKDKLNIARHALRFTTECIGEYKEAAESMYSRKLDINHYASDVLDACLEVTAAQAVTGADALAAALQVTEAQRELERKSFARKIERRGEILEDILNRYESERCGIGSIRGTAWAAFNAVTEHADHAKIGKQARDQETRLSRRFESTLTGDADEMKQVAYQLATV